MASLWTILQNHVLRSAGLKRGDPLRIGDSCILCTAWASSETNSKERDLLNSPWWPVYCWKVSVLGAAGKIRLSATMKSLTSVPTEQSVDSL